jgi:hypothetical protein
MVIASNTDNCIPNLTWENTESVDPNLPKLRIDKLEPRCAKSATESAEPRRANERTDREEPTWMKAKVEQAEPNRANDRTLTLEPTWVKSKIDNAPLIMEVRCKPTPVPAIDTEELILAKFLKDREDPKWRKFNTDAAEPHRAKLRNDIVDPNSTWAIIDKAETEPVVNNPKHDILEPHLAKLRSDKLEPQCTNRAIEMAEPKRAKERILIEDPRCVCAITDAWQREPNLTRPKTLKDEPKRANCLRDIAELIWQQSKIDAALPIRAKERIETPEPKCRKLNNEVAEPSLANERRLNELANSTAFMIDKLWQEPIFAKPWTETAEPSLIKLRVLTDEPKLM